MRTKKEPETKICVVTYKVDMAGVVGIKEIIFFKKSAKECRKFMKTFNPYAKVIKIEVF